MLAKGPIGFLEAKPVSKEDWVRCARHCTLAWKIGGRNAIQKDAGLIAYCTYMSRKKTDATGNFLPDDASGNGAPSLVNCCITAISNNEETYPNTFPWLEQLRELKGPKVDAKGGKKK